MREELVGYMVGALDAVEKQKVEKHLAQDADLQQDLATLRKGIEPLDYDHGHLAPPLGLAQRTCEYVQSQKATIPASTGQTSLTTVTGDDTVVPTNRWSLVDVAVAAGIVFAAALLVIPGINESRFNARVAACQSNLKDIGLAIHRYSQRNPMGLIPEIPQDGPYNVAGVYAPKLLEQGLVEDSSIFYCAASELAHRQDPQEIPPWGKLVSLKGSPTKGPENQVGDLGGSYAFNMGYVQNGQYQTVSLKNGMRPTFVLMADAPCKTLNFTQSSNHGGYGQNVLFEDGHIKYLTTCDGVKCQDADFYHNDDGVIAAGRHAEDSVVGCSSDSPWK